ncbi:MAG: hypothetical protein V2A34_03540, partial [Lentisphaerota bacterium]
NTNKKLLTELKGWTASRIDWQGPLLELPEIVPPTIQLTKLNIWGTLETKEIKSKEPVKPPVSGPPLKPVKLFSPPTRTFNIIIDGRATGDLADEVVVQFVKTIRQSSAFQPLLASIKLQGIRRETGGSEESDIRIFTIEALTIPREQK